MNSKPIIIFVCSGLFAIVPLLVVKTEKQKRRLNIYLDSFPVLPLVYFRAHITWLIATAIPLFIGSCEYSKYKNLGLINKAREIFAQFGWTSFAIFCTYPLNVLMLPFTLAHWMALLG